MKRLTTLFAAFLLSFNALAKCTSPEKTIFSCLTAKAKKIEVCDAGKNIVYSFGFPNSKPEIVLNVPRAMARKESIVGTGCINNSVSIPNGNTTYNIYSIESLRQPCDEAGVEVYINEKYAATVKCKSSVTDNISNADLLEKE